MSTARWYIVHTLSGVEKKVAEAIKEQAELKGLSDHIEEVVVPSEDVVEVRKGKKVTAQRKFFPGYILVKMILNDNSWHLVKSVPKVSGFLGGQGKPQPLTEREVKNIMTQMEEGIQNPKHAVMFEIGESVKVIDGPFESFVGVVEDIDEEKARLKVSVSIFGRSTPVELEYTQVEKI